MTSTQDLWLVLGVAAGSCALMCAAAYLVFPPPRKPMTDERRRLDRLETLNRAITDALYSASKARIYTCNDMADDVAVKAMRDRLDYARDSLGAAQRAVTEWLTVAVARDRAACKREEKINSSEATP